MPLLSYESKDIAEKMKFGIVWWLSGVVLSTTSIYYLVHAEEEIINDENDMDYEDDIVNKDGIVEDIFTLDKMFRDLHPGKTIFVLYYLLSHGWQCEKSKVILYPLFQI